MTIQWYPGHIAKAEKALQDQIKLVDVVLEVRDARIPLATHHPRTQAWVGSKARILVLNRLDMIPPSLQEQWLEWFKHRGETIYLTNGKAGQGVKQLAKASQRVGLEMNQRRRDRGMLPRPVRAVMIGFPNVGKSALINRLLGRRAVKSEARPGVTKQLQWVRISDEIELLDAPGVIPSKLDSQENALKLAICDDIGEASYDNQRVAMGFVDLLKEWDAEMTATVKELGSPLERLRSRYHLDPTSITGEEFVHNLAQLRHQGDIERSAREILNDYRKGQLGNIPLELPPS